MKTKLLQLLAISSVVAVGAHANLVANPAAEEPTPEPLKEARALAAKFQKALKGELQAAMKSGGPIKAVEVCHSRAPQIARELSTQSGWQIARTSLKPRNDANAPDPAESEILNQFEARMKTGEPVAKLEWWQQTDNSFTYMKAIPTGSVCTRCHGTNIDPDLKTHIEKFYPNDIATGFKPGDIRGAFSFRKSEARR